MHVHGHLPVWELQLRADNTSTSLSTATLIASALSPLCGSVSHAQSCELSSEPEPSARKRAAGLARKETWRHCSERQSRQQNRQAGPTLELSIFPGSQDPSQSGLAVLCILPSSQNPSQSSAPSPSALHFGSGCSGATSGCFSQVCRALGMFRLWLCLSWPSMP